MKHKKIIIALSIIILIVIIVVCFIVFSKKRNLEEFAMQRPNMEWQDSSKTGQLENRTRKNQTSTLNENSEITSAISENVELHATYYLSEVCVEEKQYVEKGTNILKYTNGTYLTAPYDCYIVELNLPEIEGKVLNSHYVQIESKNMLSVSMKVDETQINNVNIGKEATIEVTAIDKKYTGYITNIGSVASNGKFDVTIEFENDGNVMIGMTADVEISI